MSKTSDALKEAFAGESQANRRYLAYAQKAEDDGFPAIARLFRAVAQAETVHANSHLRAAGGINSTAENLQAAIGGENYEVTSMYPAFIKDAEEEGEEKAKRSFTWAWEVEKIHEQLYRKALANLGKETEQVDYYVCPVCGYTHEGTPPEKCPVCGVPSKRFQKVD